MKKRLRVAMIAPPWLSVPPQGYGGIEEVLDGLVRGLKKLDVQVELFSIGQTRIRGVKTHSLFRDEQFDHIYRPIYESSPIAVAHILFAASKVAEDGNFDIIHDHNPYYGPLGLSLAAQIPGMPPVIHTYHGPPFNPMEAIEKRRLPDNRSAWHYLGNSKGFYVIGISDTLMKKAPRQLKPVLLPAVHNGVSLERFPFQPNKGNYFITLARFNKDKAQHIAATLCDELGYKLKMAGTIAAINSPRQLASEIANPLSKYRAYDDFKYYSDKVLPITIKNPNIVYIGNLNSTRKLRCLSRAKALLFPIQWDEPFGMAVIEALACGTPVVAMKRGSMREIIEHGVNGFLAHSPSEFKEFMQRVDEINPENCRKSVQQRFSTEIMAQNYLNRYRSVL